MTIIFEQPPSVPDNGDHKKLLRSAFSAAGCFVASIYPGAPAPAPTTVTTTPSTAQPTVSNPGPYDKYPGFAAVDIIFAIDASKGDGNPATYQAVRV